MPIPKKLWGTPLRTTTQEESVAEAAKKMVEAGIGALVVVEGDELIGIISERDIMNKIVASERDPRTVKVKEIMTTPVVTVSMDEDVNNALSTMTKKQLRYMVIVDGENKPVAMLSFRDLFMYCLEKAEDEKRFLAAMAFIDSPGG